MNLIWDGGSELIERSARLLALTDSLNLEDLDRKRRQDADRPMIPMMPLCATFVRDFFWLRSQVLERKRLVCVYGVDDRRGLAPSTDDSQLFRKMSVLALQLFTQAQAPAAYCTLRSQLCLEVNDFFDDLCLKLDKRLQYCKSTEDSTRLLKVIFRLNEIYNVFLY